MFAKVDLGWHTSWYARCQVSLRPYRLHIFSAVQPNLKPPVTTTEQALAYKKELEALDPHVEYLMTLYLCPELTPEEIRKASQAGIAGE